MKELYFLLNNFYKHIILFLLLSRASCGYCQVYFSKTYDPYQHSGESIRGLIENDSTIISLSGNRCDDLTKSCIIYSEFDLSGKSIKHNLIGLENEDLNLGYNGLKIDSSYYLGADNEPFRDYYFLCKLDQSGGLDSIVQLQLDSPRYYEYYQKSIIEYNGKGGLIDVKVLLAIFSVTGTKPHAMKITEDMLMGKQNLKAFDSIDKRLENIMQDPPEFISYSQFTKTDKYQTFSTYYFEKLKRRIKKAADRIFIYDYLVNSTFTLTEKDKKNYFSGYDQFYSTITSKAKNENIRCTRIVGLPISLNGLFDFEDLELKDDIHKGVFLFSVEFFDHILECYEQYKSRFFLTISNSPSRSFVIMIIDSKYIASEYYRIKKRKEDKFIMIPNIMFIDTVQNDNHIKILLDTYESEFLGLEQVRMYIHGLLGILNTIIGKLDLALIRLQADEKKISKKYTFEESAITKMYENLFEKFEERKEKVVAVIGRLDKEKFR